MFLVVTKTRSMYRLTIVLIKRKLTLGTSITAVISRALHTNAYNNDMTTQVAMVLNVHNVTVYTG